MDLEDGDVSGWVRLYDSARLVVHGKDFMVDASPQPLGDIAAFTGTLSGLYDSDRAFIFRFERHDESRIQLVPTPEPSPILMQATCLIALVALRRRAGRSASRTTELRRALGSV